MTPASGDCRHVQFARREVGKLALALLATSCAPRAGVPITAAPESSVAVPVASHAAVCRPRVLAISTTAGFRHDSILTAQSTLRNMAAIGTFDVTITEDLSAISPSSLGSYDVVFFCLTSGELALDATQKKALLDFVGDGRGFAGVHSATDTLYNWPEYGTLIGARFKEHPWVQPGGVIVEDTTFQGFSTPSYTLQEEFYTFQENPRPSVNVLARLDAASVGASGDYPLAWWKQIGNGRSFYHALGHFNETWQNPVFQQQLVGGLLWAAGNTGRTC